MRHNDWNVSMRHRDLVRGIAHDSLREAQLQQSIVGVVGKRITDDLRAGIWMMPLGSDVVKTFSSIHDVDRKTLLVAALGNSTRQSESTPPLFALSEALRTMFASRRCARLEGELFSWQETADYDIDDKLARKYDVIQIILSTRLREDR